MKEGRPSFTAVYVAFARALASHERELSRACQDEAAEALLPRTLAQLIQRARGPGGEALMAALRESSLGMFDHLALRTRVIDDAVNQAMARGVRQLVVLGAGLDARAYRMPQLSETVVFEVDHPSTQRMKQRKASALPVLAREVRYVACDFERQALADVLRDAGFDTSQPTVWIWEGVTMYLPPVAVEGSLDVMAQLSASGSRLIASYITPSIGVTRWIGLMGMGILGAIAEPLRGFFQVEEMATLLRRRGFERTLDVLPRKLAQRYGIRIQRVALAIPAEHIVVADKLSSGKGAESP